MEERYQNSVIGSKIKTLKESLQQFGKPSLLKELDASLELVRRNKEFEEVHSKFLKSVDKDLLLQSRIHHPDKAIGEMKSDEEVTNAQNLQTALNATRTVLKALTEVFLKDIDVHYKYEFFAKLDVNTLVSETRIELEINNVLCKISHLSEVKRVNIVGEIRKFLQESRECLRNFLKGTTPEFARHRDNGLYHLRKCIEGYKVLEMECELILEDCRVENDENSRRVIKNIHTRSRIDCKILQDLEAVAERSLDGNFEIFPIYEPKYSHQTMEQMGYKPVVPKEREYLVSPFLYYVDVMLMCSVMVDKKSIGKKIASKIEKTFEYLLGFTAEESIDFIGDPLLLKAYYLASYINNKNHYKGQVQRILIELDYDTSESYIIRYVFKETVEEIEKILAEKFDINSYKEGKSNREQFNERLFKLNDAMAEFNEVEKNLLEQFKLYEQETDEIRKEYLKLSKNIEKTELEHQKNISECGRKKEIANGTVSDQNNFPEIGMFNQNETHKNETYFKDSCNATKSVNDIEEHEKNLCLRSCTQNTSNQMMQHLNSSNRNKYPTTMRDTTQKGFKEYKENFQGRDKSSEVNAEKIPSFTNAVSEEVQRTIAAQKLFLYGDKTKEQTTQMTFDTRHKNFPSGDKVSKLYAEKNPSFNVELSEEVQRIVRERKLFSYGDKTADHTTQTTFDTRQKTFQGDDKISIVDAEKIRSFNDETSEEVRRNIEAKKLYPSGGKSADQTRQRMIFDPRQKIFEGSDKISIVDAEKIRSFNDETNEEVRRNIEAKKLYPSGGKSADQTRQRMIFDPRQKIFEGSDKISKGDAEKISSFNGDQLQQEPINFDLSDFELE